MKSISVFLDKQNLLICGKKMPMLSEFKGMCNVINLFFESSVGKM